MRQKKRILVTGGAGFIGSHLCEALLEQDPHSFVYCLDNFYTGQEANISHLALSYGHRFTFIHHDVIHPILNLNNLNILEISHIYHLACPASPVHYQKDPLYTLKTNFLGGLNILELAQKTEARILFASTSEVYGDPKMHPQSEHYFGNVNSFGPRACYDEGKRAVETLMYDFHHQYGLNIRIARIFNTYGPKMQPNDGRVVSNFIMQALLEQPITLYGDGSQTRSFCYVDDLVNGLIMLMATPDIHFPVNLGNPTELQIKEIAKLILNLTKSQSNLIYQPLPHDDPLLRCPDIQLAQKTLNWQPSISLETGLKKTIDYFQCLLNKINK